MKWVNNWPVIGLDKDQDGKGEPVMEYKKPEVNKSSRVSNPQESDEFNTTNIGLQWQWQANPQAGWAFPFPAIGCLRLNAQPLPDSAKNYWGYPAILSQKFPAETFMATIKVNFKPKLKGEKLGLMVLGTDYAYAAIEKNDDLRFWFAKCLNAEKGNAEVGAASEILTDSIAYLRVSVNKGAICRFSYSRDGQNYIGIGEDFVAKPGRWTGARIGIFCSRQLSTNDAGYADIDWFQIEPLR